MQLGCCDGAAANMHSSLSIITQYSISRVSQNAFTQDPSVIFMQLVEKRQSSEGVNYLNSNPWYWNVLADDTTNGGVVRALKRMFDTQGAQ